MLKSYIRIAWRNITRHKIFTFINVLGLSLGLCSCVVIYLITRFEYSFDDFHPDKERIYRLLDEDQFVSGAKMFAKNVPPPVPLAIRQEIPGLEAVSGFYPYWTTIDIAGETTGTHKFNSRIDGSYITTTIIADASFFTIFKYDWLAGNPTISLQEPFNVVLSESRAHTYFGDLPPDKIMGRELLYNDSIRVRVSGIVKDWNKNTDFLFTDFISFSTIRSSSFLKNRYSTADWKAPRGIATFVKLSGGVSPDRVNGQLAGFLDRHRSPNPLFKTRLYLQPLSDIHFNTDVNDDFRKANLPTLYSLVATALFILILAIVNFINLSTALSIQRAKEIGVRKVLGSGRASLIYQFLAETFLHVLLAVVIAVLLVQPVLSVFHDFIPPGVRFHFWDRNTLLFLLLVTLITSLLAGLYPARVVSSYLPVLSLKGGGVQKGSEKWWLRKGLIVFQFTVALIFIIGTIVIGNQNRFIRNKDLGLNTDAIINLIPPYKDSISNTKVLADRIRQVPGVSRTAREIFPPVGAPSFLMMLTYKGKNETKMRVLTRGGDENLIPLYQMRLLAGRNLEQSDSMRELVINESLAKALGFSHPADALDKFLYTDSLMGNKVLQIVGVAADVNEYSLRESVKPMVIAHIPRAEDRLAVKLATRGKQLTDAKVTLSKIEKVWKEVYPKAPFNYTFLDESIALMYEKERQTATLMNVAMSITIFISCLGLFGLALFTAEKRTKEIGIRKVLGASVTDIVAMLSKDFVLLVIIALFIASPIAWIIMHRWLQNFAYRVDIRWWVFVVAGLGAIGIALLTVSWQSIRAALANPVKSLRTE